MKIIRWLKRCLIIIRFKTIARGVVWNDGYMVKDLMRWKQICHIKGTREFVLAYLLWQYPEFRNLFIYRNRYRRIYRMWVSLWYKPMDTLYLQAKEIGGGLFIQHGFATMVTAEKVGENCWINQQVTIGYKDHGRPPVIGDDVMITCGAKVLGNITVGDHAVIGANAVVTRDVEPGAVMGGIPARRIR